MPMKRSHRFGKEGNSEGALYLMGTSSFRIALCEGGRGIPLMELDSQASNGVAFFFFPETKNRS